MADLPPLPEPGFQSADDRRAIGRRFIMQARYYLEQRDHLQAGEKAWGAIAHNLKVIGEQRGWLHGNHQQIENIGRQIVVEVHALYPDLGEAISDVFHYGHRNFYENMRSLDEMNETVAWAEEAVEALEELQYIPPVLSLSRPTSSYAGYVRSLATMSCKLATRLQWASP